MVLDGQDGRPHIYNRRGEVVSLADVRAAIMLGGGALGFQNGHARAGRLEARFRCIGAVDVDPAACADFERLTGQRETCLDLFDADQYERWHGHAPPRDWRPATAAGWYGPDDPRASTLVIGRPPAVEGAIGVYTLEATAREVVSVLNSHFIEARVVPVGEEFAVFVHVQHIAVATVDTAPLREAAEQLAETAGEALAAADEGDQREPDGLAPGPDAR